MIFSLAMTRRQFVKLATIVCTPIAGALHATGAEPRGDSPTVPPRKVDGDEALRELMAGNVRFAAGRPTNPRRSPAEFRALAESQHPIAAILSCADSRVAPEILFDVGKGDIFVVRVAGNVVSGAGAVVKGSLEYAVAELNVPLIMILGHTNCGAVKAAMAHLHAHDALPGSINDLVELIKPAVEASKGTARDPLDAAIRKNVILGVERLTALEPIVAKAVSESKLKIVGGVYDLRTGKVTLID